MILIYYIEMKNYFKEAYYQLSMVLISLAIGGTFFVSCVDENSYSNKEPEWLGASIYDYLKTDGHFTTYVKLIDELGYTETLSKTGSKTLFVANDSAFTEFFKSNAWGVMSYEQLTLAQKKLILNFGMINNAYTSDNLPNFNSGFALQEGAAMRRSTALSIFDSVPHEFGDNLPSGALWDKYKTKGIFILKDITSSPLVQFTQKQMDQALITNEDFRFLTGNIREKNDIHIFGNKVIKRDITCKNGYINILKDVMIPPVNMAQFIRNNSNTNIPLNKRTAIFSSLLDRFCAPYFSKANTVSYIQLQLSHPELPVIDSLFDKGYFSLSTYSRYPNGQAISSDLLLPFDPGWNSYVRNASNSYLQSDMGAIIVPSDEAMENYRKSGVLQKYNSWSEVPDKVIISFLKKHMKSSLIGSVPSRFANLMDDQNYPLPVQTSDIPAGNVYLGVNGAVYVSNKVYIPEDYASVYAPVLFSDDTKIFDWFIQKYGGDVPLYKYYLLSLINTYSFFVPTDKAFEQYIDPVAYSKTVPGVIKFWYNTKTSAVNATLYKYDKVTNTVLDSVPEVITDLAFIQNRLLDIIESHIIVNGVESGNKFYLSKGNNVVKVTGAGNDMKVEGGGDLWMNTNATVSKAYQQSNGNTYFISKPIQTPLNSAYKALSENDNFREFFNLLSGFPVKTKTVTPTGPIMFNTVKGMDFNINFFNTFNYTIYVPTNEKIQEAIIAKKITPWVSQTGVVGINDMTDATEKAAEIVKLERFLRYHFQDNSVFVGGKSITNQYYQSATIKKDDGVSLFGTYKTKYFKIRVSVSGSNTMTLKTENGGSADVVNDPSRYNIMVRDYIFNSKPTEFKELDGTSVGTLYPTSRIETSSTAVIHQIDNVLSFQ